MLLFIFSNVTCITALNKVKWGLFEKFYVPISHLIYTISCTGMFIKIESYHDIS